MSDKNRWYYLFFIMVLKQYLLMDIKYEFVIKNIQLFKERTYAKKFLKYVLTHAKPRFARDDAQSIIFQLLFLCKTGNVSYIVMSAISELEKERREDDVNAYVRYMHFTNWSLLETNNFNSDAFYNYFDHLLLIDIAVNIREVLTSTDTITMATIDSIVKVLETVTTPPIPIKNALEVLENNIYKHFFTLDKRIEKILIKRICQYGSYLDYTMLKNMYNGIDGKNSKEMVELIVSMRHNRELT